MATPQQVCRIGLLEFIRGSSNTQFVVPVYQRKYTWTTKEVSQYLDDLEGIINGNFDKHFLGIITYLDQSISYTEREFSIIDGQQRLITTFLMLYAIKYLLEEKGLQDEADDVTYQYLEYTTKRITKSKLKPLVLDDDVYQHIIDCDFEGIYKNSNIYCNFIYIKKRLGELFTHIDFETLFDALEEVYIVCIPVLESDYPQKIFESINSTGVKLSASDLIRNFMLMTVNSDEQDYLYAKYWKKIEQNISIDSKKLEIYFRMFLAVKTYSLINIKSIYDGFKTWYNNELESKNIEDIFKEIVEYSGYYYDIYKRDIDTLDDEIKDSIREFREILYDMPAPFLMGMYKLYKNKESDSVVSISGEQFASIVSVINSYLIRRAISGLDTSDITRLFPTLLKNVLDDCNEDYSKIVEYTKKNLINKNRGKSAYMPDDTQLKNAVRYANVYNLRLPLKVILKKLENQNNSAPVNFKNLSIEHLMPQTPTKEWLEALGVNEIEYENNVHRLGNLTLAAKIDNSKMKNNPWDYKKAVLASTSHLKINEEILQTKEWNLKAINDRTEKLLDKINELYPYCSASDDVIIKYNLSLDSSGIHAEGILYEEDGSVEILAGSEMVDYRSIMTGEAWEIEYYEDLLEDQIIKENENKMVFIKNYVFTVKRKTALSLTASLLTGGSKSGWESWKDVDGNVLNESKYIQKNKFQSE